MQKIYDLQPKLDFNDVLIVPKISSISSRSDVDLTSKMLTKALGIKTNGIVAANMDGVGTIEVAKVLKQYGSMTALVKHYNLDTLLDFFATDESSHSFYSMGMSTIDYEKFIAFYGKYKNKEWPLKICIDVANGYMKELSNFCKKIAMVAPDAIIMAGNVVNLCGVENLNAANIVKVGIGQGSACLTRTQTGVGYPQLSAIYDIMQHDDDASVSLPLICSDGGCSQPGDIVKALGAGANMIMLGGMLAGTDQGMDEHSGGIVEISGQRYAEFYGMSSTTAQRKHNNGLKSYRSSEGRTTLIPYKGDLNDTIKNILGGIRSGCAYIGAQTIDDVRNNVEFIRVNSILNTSFEKFSKGN